MPQPHPQTEAPELYPDKVAIQDVDFEIDPLTCLPRGLLLISGSERYLLSYPDIPSSQTVLEICIQRGSSTIYSPPF